MSSKKRNSRKYRKKKAKRRFKRHLKAKKRREKRKQDYSSPKNIIYSRIISYFKERNLISKRKRSDSHSYNLKIPKTFSFIEKPDQTISIIQDLISYVSDPHIVALNIDHSKCEKLDIAASTIMDVLIMEVKRECLQKRKRLFLGGQYSKKEYVNELLKVTGLLKHIKHRDSNVPQSVLENYEVYDLVIGKSNPNTKSKESSKAEIEGTKLTDYINKLLQKHKVELTPRGKNRASTLITEVLDNAEQHSETLTWYLLGYVNKEMECNITIFNFGSSISETLSSAPLYKKTKKNIQELIEKHTNKGFFSLGNKWNEHNLWTLYALQEGVSRFNIDQIDAEVDRGQGTTKMIDFFLKLSYDGIEGNKPKLVLISGNTYILFDGTYQMRDKYIDGQPIQVIAFNEENDLEIKPDHKFVKNLDGYFPGTLISMKFSLDKAYLQKKAQNN